MGRIVLPGDIEVVVVSYGGVGTTFLLRFLEQYMKTNDPDDADGFKHSALPHVSSNTNLKFLYVYGNPKLAAVSLFRRGYHHAQSIKLQQWGKNSISPIPNEMTLQEYASLGVDKFNFKNNFYNWYETYLPKKPIMFVRYEKIFDNVEAIINFLDLPKETIGKFPENISRSSSLDDIPVEALKQLDEMYGDFANNLAKLDDVEIRSDTSNAFSIIKYFNVPYLKAFKDQILYVLKEFVKNYFPYIFAQLKKIKKNS